MDQVSQRERLRQTFNGIAPQYQGARPEYPAALYADLLSLTGVRPATDVLCEVGAASGKATLPLARLGFAPLVVHRVASTAALRRSLGLNDAPEHMAVLRRARLVRAHRNGLTVRVARRGA